MKDKNTTCDDIKNLMEKNHILDQAKLKKNAKDSVFCDLFGNPKYLLQLYKALHPEDTEVTQEQIGNVTMRNILLDQMYNDLGFTVGSKLLVLMEAQSTWSKNIVIRVLLYLANTWQEYIESKHLNTYGSKQSRLVYESCAPDAGLLMQTYTNPNPCAS